MSEQLDPRYSTMEHMPPPLQPQAKISSGWPVVLCQFWVNRYHDTVLLDSPTSEYRAHTAHISTKKERQRADPRDHLVPKPLAQ